MTSQQPQVPNAAIPPHVAQNSSVQQARPHIQANQLDSSQSSATAGPVDHRALTGRPGCSGVAATSGEVANRNSSSTRRDGGFEPWPEEAVDNSHGLYSLHRMFDIVGAQLTHRDVRVLSFLFVDVIDEYERGGIRSGRDFLLALERQGRCDETNFRHILQLLRIITRHDLLPYVTLRKRQAGECSTVMFTTGNIQSLCISARSVWWSIPLHHCLFFYNNPARCASSHLLKKWIIWCNIFFNVILMI